MGVGATTLTVNGGFVTVPLSCPRAATGSCDGLVWLERRVGRKTTRLGSGEFVTRAGRRDPVLVALTRAARRLVSEKKKVSAKLRVRGEDEAENPIRNSKQVQLRSARR
jgi:hypothetical protein